MDVLEIDSNAVTTVPVGMLQLYINIGEHASMAGGKLEGSLNTCLNLLPVVNGSLCL
jgi:hypothetical protein